MILSIIGIVLGVIAIGLFTWLRREQEMNEGLNTAETQHTHQGMNAMMDDFNNYQVETDRKIAELEKQLTVKSKENERKIIKVTESLPAIIRNVVGHIEFSRPLDKK
tara:strand:+ start:431 stop:751 length:321 start_codon:yes stop_codon:yes gene_type:complete